MEEPAHALELDKLRVEHSKRMADLQDSRDSLEDEYEDLFDSHQMMSITLQDAHQRQDDDAMAYMARHKRCVQLEAEGVRDRNRIEKLEFVMAGEGTEGTDGTAAVHRNVRADSVLWWKQRCRSMQDENKRLENKLAFFSDEACPLLCGRPFSHSMQCCDSKICGPCLARWAIEKQCQKTSSCPFCRVSPSKASSVDRVGNRPGTQGNPIELL